MSGKVSDAVRARVDALAFAGHLAPDAPGFASGGAEDAAHAARVRVQLRALAPERVEEARFLAFGCPTVIACASWYAEALSGRAPVVPAPREAIAALQVHPDRAWAAELAARAAEAAVADWRRRHAAPLDEPGAAR